MAIDYAKIEEMFLHIILEAPPGNFFDDRCEDGGAGIAVSHPAAGTPTRDAGRRAESQRIRQRDGRRIIERILTKMDVVKTRCVFHQVY